MTIKKILLSASKEPLFIEDITGKKFTFPGISISEVCLADVATVLIGAYNASNKLYGLIERTPDYTKIISEIKLSDDTFKNPLYSIWKNTVEIMYRKVA